MLFRQLFDKASSTFTYLIASAKGREALIIDPVLDNINEYIVLLNELDLRLVKVIDTHIHADHITGASKLKDQTNCYTIMGEQTPANAVDLEVKDEEIIKLDQIEIKALYTPGHTSDSFSFLMNDCLFSGDTLLINGTGRTDFQNGSAKDAYNSIFNKLLKLPEKTLLYPAHDYNGEKVSSIGKEKKFNPRLQVSSENEYVEIMNNLNLPNPSMMDVAVPSNLELGINFNKQKVNNGIEPEKFNEIKKDEQSVLIDLREQNEIDKEGMIKNSLVVRFPEINEYLHKNKDILKNKRILFYCAHGHRSTLAVQLSKSYQFTNCFHLIGGLKNWKKEGLEL